MECMQHWEYGCIPDEEERVRTRAQRRNYRTIPADN